VPESRIEEVRATRTNPRTIDWPSPATGTVIEKRVIKGQQVLAGTELYRIADLSQVWVIAEVAEGDLGGIAVGMPASITLRAYPDAPVGGRVSFLIARGSKRPSPLATSTTWRMPLSITALSGMALPACALRCPTRIPAEDRDVCRCRFLHPRGRGAGCATCRA
jgi:hypothetical protein